MKIDDFEQSPIAPISPAPHQEAVRPDKTIHSFGRILDEAVNRVNDLRQNADQAVVDLASGKNNNIHETMIAMEKASISFKLMMEVRNKLVAAYDQINRMQV